MIKSDAFETASTSDQGEFLIGLPQRTSKSLAIDAAAATAVEVIEFPYNQFSLRGDRSDVVRVHLRNLRCNDRPKIAGLVIFSQSIRTR